MYIKLTNGVPEKYTIGQLRRDNPQTSFPKSIPDSILADYDVYPLTPTTQPAVDYTKNIDEGTPTLVNGAWLQVWDITDATAEQIAERTDEQASNIRRQRNRLLSDCDWTQLPDAPVDATSWTTYRQSLRDISSQENFPWNVIWPEKPL